MNRRLLSECGASVLEVIIAIIILGTVAGFGALKLRELLAGPGLRKIAQDLVNALERNAQLSVLHGKEVRAAYDSVRHALVFTGLTLHGVNELAFPPDLRVDERCGNPGGPPGACVLRPGGAATPGRFTLQGRGERCEIRQSLYGARTFTCLHVD